MGERSNSVKRPRAIMALILGGIMWGGSIPWVIYLTMKDKSLWLVPVICIPLYVFLLYNLRHVWRRAWQKDPH
jgi:hypothetical protein